MNRTTFIILVLTGVLFLSACSEAEPAGADKQERMNTLFIVVVDFRPEIHSTGYNEIITPNIDRLAESHYNKKQIIR